MGVFGSIGKVLGGVGQWGMRTGARVIPDRWATKRILEMKSQNLIGDAADTLRNQIGGTAGEILAQSDKSQAKHLLQIAGVGGIFGGVIAAFQGENVIGGAIREAASFALWETAFPAVNLIQGSVGLGGLLIGIPTALERMDQSSHFNTLNEGYIRSKPMLYNPSEGANLRRKSLGYILQSRQNTRSFIGSESVAMHDQGGY